MRLSPSASFATRPLSGRSRAPQAIFGEAETRHLPRIVRLIRVGFLRFAIGAADAQQDWLHVDNLTLAVRLAAARLTAAAPDAPPGGRAYFINDDQPVNTLAFFAPLARVLNRSATPLLRVPLSLALAGAWLFEQGWYRLGIPPFMTQGAPRPAAAATAH